MNDRIRSVRLALGLKQKEFAARIGLKQNSLSNIEKGERSVTQQTILAICSQFCVNETWLRTGVGEMFLTDEKRRKDFFDVFEQLSPASQEYLLITARALLDAQKPKETIQNEAPYHP